MTLLLELAMVVFAGNCAHTLAVVYVGRWHQRRARAKRLEFLMSEDNFFRDFGNVDDDTLDRKTVN